MKPIDRLVTFAKQKTMYSGKFIASGAVIFIFASENEGGSGLFALGRHCCLCQRCFKEAWRRTPAPRVNIVVRFDRSAPQCLGRAELKSFSNWNDGKPETELNFKLYRQTTNKVVGITLGAASFLTALF